MGKDKERYSGTETNDEAKTKAETETRIVHKEEHKGGKRSRDETELEDKNKGKTEAETYTRRDKKRQENKETTGET